MSENKPSNQCTIELCIDLPHRSEAFKEDMALQHAITEAMLVELRLPFSINNLLQMRWALGSTISFDSCFFAQTLNSASSEHFDLQTRRLATVVALWSLISDKPATSCDYSDGCGNATACRCRYQCTALDMLQDENQVSPSRGTPATALAAQSPNLACASMGCMLSADHRNLRPKILSPAFCKDVLVMMPETVLVRHD